MLSFFIPSFLNCIPPNFSWHKFHHQNFILFASYHKKFASTKISTSFIILLPPSISCTLFIVISSQEMVLLKSTAKSLIEGKETSDYLKEEER